MISRMRVYYQKTHIRLLLETIFSLELVKFTFQIGITKREVRKTVVNKSKPRAMMDL
jgi:hypothetical protein